MPDPRPDAHQPPPEPDAPSRHADDTRAFAWAGRPASLWTLVLGLFAFRLIWLVFFSELTLVEDEAHYWDWSRRPDWSYATKGPGVAWAIWLSTNLFGHTEWAVRLPALLASAVSALAIADLARRAFDDRRVGFFAAAVWQCLPGVGITSVLMTIDGPYLACWAVVCWAWWRASRERWRPGWAVAGLVLALGFLFKYTIVLLLVGLALDWLFRARRTRGSWRQPAITLALASLGLLPVLIWNAQHDWVTFRHLLGHLGVRGGEGVTAESPGWTYTPMWTLEFIVLQTAVTGPAIALMIAGIVGARRGRALPALLLWSAAPVFVFYLLVTLFTRAEGNWAMGGFVTLCPLAGWMVVSARQRRVTWLRLFWGATAVTGLLTLLVSPLASLAARLPGVGEKIPVHRMMGMREHAQAAHTLAERLRAETGLEPFYVTGHYGRASQLAFYLPGHPTVYCAATALGGSSRQFDHWPETNLARPEVNDALRGRPALIFTGRGEPLLRVWSTCFETIEDAGPLPSEPKANRTTLIGHTCLGFARTPPARETVAEPADRP
jgi:hypothetical protein